MKLVPVEGDPFAPKLVPVEGNPFATLTPEDPGVMAAIGLGFGRQADKVYQGLKQAGLTVGSMIPGMKDSAEAKLAEMQATEQFRDEGYKPLQEQHPYATMAGEAAPLVAMPMGGTVKGAMAIGALPGLIEYGTPKEKLTRGALGAAGSGVGYGIGKGIGAVVSPGMKPASSEVERLAEVAAREGIPLDAAQITGNPVLQNAKAALAKIPWTSTGQAQKAAQQQDAYGSAILRKMGSEGAAATPDVMGDAYNRIGGKIAEAADSVSLSLDDKAVEKLAEVERKFLRRLPTDQKPVIQSYLDDLTNLIGKPIPGDVYQATRSELGKLAFESDNATIKHSAKELQKVLDDAFDRQAPKEAVEMMKKARKEYAIYSTTADAVKRSRAQDGRPSAKQMYATAQGDIPGFERGAGGDFADLVRAGRQFLPDPIPNSGTAERAAFMNLMTAGSMSGLGALGGALQTGSDGKSNAVPGALLGLAGFGTSKAAQKLLNSPELTKYLMTKLLEEEQKRLLARGGATVGLLGASSQ